MKEGWNVIIKYAPEWRGVNVWLVHRAGSQETVVNPVDLTQTTTLLPAEMAPEPTLRFSGHDATQFLQGLTDGLVEAGFKPNAIKIADEKVEAIQYHLEDMRSLVFKGPFKPAK